MADLFNEIDAEADPHLAKIYVLKPDSDGMYATFDWKNIHDEKDVAVEKTSKGLRVSAIYGKVKRLQWPRHIFRMWMRTLCARGCSKADESRIRTMVAEDIKAMPAEPTHTFTVSEIRAMDSFSGVYFSFNEDGTCHYVGESEDVTCRVSRARPEIGNRRIGVIKCMPHERKRIECYYKGLLDPPGNSESTHKMKSKGVEQEAKDGR